MKNSLSVCSGKMTLIMPSKPIKSQLPYEWLNVFKRAVCNRIETMDKSIFPTTQMDNTAVFYFDRGDKPENYCKRLDVDKTIYRLFDNEGHRLFIDKMKKESLVPWKYKIDCKNTVENQTRMLVERMKTGHFYLNLNRSGQGAVWFSGTLYKVGILDSEGEIAFFTEHTRQKNILECPNREYGENLKRLMYDGLVLKYGLWLTRHGRNILTEQFKYVPDIDYTNIHTDEELLAACGFTPEEIVKTMDYLRHFDFSQNRNDLIRNYN